MVIDEYYTNVQTQWIIRMTQFLLLCVSLFFDMHACLHGFEHISVNSHLPVYTCMCGMPEVDIGSPIQTLLFIEAGSLICSKI